MDTTKDDLFVGKQPVLPSILGPRPSLLGPRPSILGPHPFRGYSAISTPYCKKSSFCPPIVIKVSAPLHSKKRGPLVLDVLDSEPFKKGRRNSTGKLVVSQDNVRKRKRVWEMDTSIMGNMDLSQKKAKNIDDFNQLASQQQHFYKFGTFYTPQPNEFVNFVDDYACAMCYSNCLKELLVVAFVLSGISTKKFVFSRSMIDNLKKCWISLDTDREIHPLACSCHLRLFIRFVPLFFKYHSNSLMQSNNTFAQADITTELTSVVSTLRSSWVRRKLQPYEDVTIICFNRLSLLFIMFNVYFSVSPSIGALVAITALSVL